MADEPVVRLAPRVREQLDAQRERDRAREMSEWTPQRRDDAKVGGLLGSLVTDLSRDLHARQDAVIERAIREGWRVAFGPIEFSGPERDDGTYRVTAERDVRILRPGDPTDDLPPGTEILG